MKRNESRLGDMLVLGLAIAVIMVLVWDLIVVSGLRFLP